MKKMLLLFVSSLLFFGFVGCSSSNSTANTTTENSDGFTYVCRIDFRSDGNNTTRYSTSRSIYTIAEEVTENDFYNAAIEKRIDYGNVLEISEEINQAAILTQDYIIPDWLNGESIYIQYITPSDNDIYYVRSFYDVDNATGESLYHYYKAIFSRIEYRYIQVKVINPQSIAIRDSSGETVYTVTQYSIKCFN